MRSVIFLLIMYYPGYEVKKNWVGEQMAHMEEIRNACWVLVMKPVGYG
jgi:hypothetical protein